MKNIIELLPWDTEFFGFQTAKVETEKITPHQLTLLIDDLQKANIKLTYFIADANDTIALASLSTLLSPIDIKQYFEIDLSTNHFQQHHEISIANANCAGEDCYALAQIAGGFSRYKRDPNFPPQTFEKLYNTWIENELSDTKNCTVFTFNEQNSIAGLITLKQKEEKGIISLVAVKPNFQGKGIGKKLIEHALAHFKNNGRKNCVVASQKLNSSAASFYRKLQFKLVQEQVYFHLWL